MFRILFLALLLSYATPGMAHDCANNQQGCSEPSDQATLLQQKMVVSLQIDDLDDASVEGVDNLPHEKASDPHSNGTAYEVFVEVWPICSDDDSDCKEKQLRRAFRDADMDADERLTAAEVHADFFDGSVIDAGTYANHSANVNASQTVMSFPAAEMFIELRDTDGSGWLSLEEFLTPPPGASASPPDNATGLVELLADGITHRQILNTTNVINQCLANTIDSVKKVVEKKNCFVSREKVESCWTRVDIWNAGFWECKWETVVKTFSCFVEIVAETVTEVAAGFQDCFQNVIEEVKKTAAQGAKAFMDLLPPGCKSPEECLDSLKNAPGKLVDEVTAQITNGVTGLLESTSMGKGFNVAKSVAQKLPPLAETLVKIVGNVGSVVVKFVDGSLTPTKDFTSDLSFCSEPGVGFWKLAPTDCGAFDALKKTITEIAQVWKIKENFEDTVKKFGSCITKSSMLSLPTPFLNFEVSKFCVPGWLQEPIKGIVGSFRYLASGAGGCSNNNDPVCQMVTNLKSVESQLAGAFSNANLLQQGVAIMGHQLHGDNRTYRVDCAGEDFKVFVDVAVGVTFPGRKLHVDMPGGDALALSIEFSTGCRKKKMFTDLTLGVAADQLVAGLGSVAVPPTMEIGGAVGFGFEISTPGDKVVDYAAQLKLVGEAKIAGITGGVELGFKLLPAPDYPKGFKLSFAPQAKPVLMQEAIADAVKHSDTVENQVYAAVATLSANAKNLDFAEDLKALVSLSSMQIGAAAMQSLRRDADLQRSRVTAGVGIVAGMEIKVCVTCGDDESGGSGGSSLSDGSTTWNRPSAVVNLANQAVTSITITSVDWNHQGIGLMFNFDAPHTWTSGQAYEVQQCRDGLPIWSGMIRWWRGSGGSTGNSRGRRDSGYALGQWQIGDTVTDGMQCPTAVNSYRVALQAPLSSNIFASPNNFEKCSSGSNVDESKKNCVWILEIDVSSPLTTGVVVHFKGDQGYYRNTDGENQRANAQSWSSGRSEHTKFKLEWSTGGTLFDTNPKYAVIRTGTGAKEYLHSNMFPGYNGASWGGSGYGWNFYWMQEDCPNKGVLKHNKCWYLSAQGSPCSDTCSSHGLDFSYYQAAARTPLVPLLLGYEPSSKNNPWAALECFVPGQDRYHTADGNGAGASDPQSFSHSACRLACPCQGPSKDVSYHFSLAAKYSNNDFASPANFGKCPSGRDIAKAEINCVWTLEPDDPSRPLISGVTVHIKGDQGYYRIADAEGHQANADSWRSKKGEDTKWVLEWSSGGHLLDSNFAHYRYITISTGSGKKKYLHSNRFPGSSGASWGGNGYGWNFYWLQRAPSFRFAMQLTRKSNNFADPYNFHKCSSGSNVAQAKENCLWTLVIDDDASPLTTGVVVHILGDRGYYPNTEREEERTNAYTWLAKRGENTKFKLEWSTGGNLLDANPIHVEMRVPSGSNKNKYLASNCFPDYPGASWSWSKGYGWNFYWKA